MFKQTQIQEANRILIKKIPELSLYKCVMFKGGVYQVWDTSDTDNEQLFVGVVVDIGNEHIVIATSGVINIKDLPDGVLYCDSSGDFVTTKPVTSFNHEVLESSNGLQIIRRAPIASTLGDLLDVLAFTNCC